MRIGPFVPCYIDAFFPEVGVATLEILEGLGIEFGYQADQTCRGQPMASSDCQPESGTIFEQPIEAADPGCEGRPYRSRRIASRPDQPTREGEAEIVLITNLPGEIEATSGREADRARREIEAHFQGPTDLLRRGIPELGCLRAALFALRMSAPSGDAPATLPGDPRAVHGDEMAAEVSPRTLTEDMAEVHPGMMIAVPPVDRVPLDSCSACELALLMNDLAEAVPIERMLRSPRNPKKPGRAGEGPGGLIHQVATQDLLEAYRGVSPPTSARSKRRSVKS